MMNKNQIKFRAWDISEKIHIFSDNEGWSQFNDWINDDNFIIEQFTTIQDINNIDIYEGDIVRINDSNKTYIIKFTNGSFKLYHTQPTLNGMLWGNLDRIKELNWELTVMGNIKELENG